MNQLLVVSYSTGNIQAAKSFYETLLRTDLAVSLTDKIQSLHTYVATGVKLTINQRQHNEQHAIAHFGVKNLDQTIRSLAEKGGKQVAGPYDIPIAENAMESLKANVKKSGGDVNVGKSMGRGAILADPDGNFVGLIQLEPFAFQAFKRGKLTEQDIADQRAALDAGKLIRHEK